MNESIHSQSDNLADIVGLEIIQSTQQFSVFWVVITCIAITTFLLFCYRYLLVHKKGQLLFIKQKLIQSHLTPREAAHQIAHKLNGEHSLKGTQLTQLNQLRFAPNKPSKQEVLDFINHV